MPRCVIFRVSCTPRLGKAVNRSYATIPTPKVDVYPNPQTGGATQSHHYQSGRDPAIGKLAEIFEPRFSDALDKKPHDYVAKEQLSHKGLAYRKTDTEELEDAYDELRAAFGIEPKPESQQSPDLPVSPLMEPEYLAARQTFKGKKAAPSKTPTLFQQQLARNPYAIALATPIRNCSISFTRLPSFFLQQLNLVAHPETNEPWWMPLDLTTKYRPTVKARGTGKDVKQPSEELGNAEGIKLANDQSRSGELSGNSAHEMSSDKPKIGRSSYILSRQDLFHSLNDDSSGYGRMAWTRVFMAPDMASVRTTRKIIESSNLRSDLDKFVLDLMQRRAREALEDLVGLKRGYVVASKSWQEASAPKQQAGAILWTGYPIQEDELRDQEISQLHGPPQFATLDIPPSDTTARKKQKLPVHNLRKLLGKEHLEKLREKFPLFNQRIVVLRDKRMTVDMQLRLWKLQGYQASYEEFMTMDEAEQIVKMIKERKSNGGTEHDTLQSQRKLEPAVRRVRLSEFEEEPDLPVETSKSRGRRKRRTISQQEEAYE